MTTFIIGGATSHTGAVLANVLERRGAPFVVSARNPATAPKHHRAVRFDWTDPTTFEAPFQASPDIDRIYFMPPTSTFHPLPVTKPFIDYAASKGVKRFVLLGATIFARDGSGTMTGSVWDYLANLGVEYTVLRPTWFIENFIYYDAATIKSRGYFSNLAQDGRIPFISVLDIAEMAADILLKKESLNGDVFILGPEVLTYDEAAGIFTEELGKKIIYHRPTVEERVDARKAHLGEDYAKALARFELGIAAGSEEARLKEPNVLLGKVTVRDVIRANKFVWLPSFSDVVSL